MEVKEKEKEKEKEKQPVVNRNLFRMLIDFYELIGVEHSQSVLVWRPEKDFEAIPTKKFAEFLSSKPWFELGIIGVWNKTKVEAICKKLSAKFDVSECFFAEETASVNLKHRVFTSLKFVLRFLCRAESSHLKSRTYLVDDKRRCTTLNYCKRVKVFTFQMLSNNHEMGEWDYDTRKERAVDNDNV